MSYYNRQGEPMTMQEWAQRLKNPEAKRVAFDVLANGYRVSTVWLGMDHGFGNGPPLIFETMVFPPGDSFADEDCDRYSTEAEALAGHAAMVAKWLQPQPVTES